ncbi:MAG: sulfotransferase [Planctomycetota bacterium]
MTADPRDQQALAEAVRLLHAKQPTEGLRALEPILPRFRKEPNVLKLHAVLLIEAGDAPKAISTIAKAKKLRPMDEGLAVAHAKILSQAGRFDEAIAAFTRCLSLKPTHTEALDGLVRALRLTQRDTEAVAAVTKAQAAGAPTDAFFAAAIGEAALVRDQGDIDPADAIDTIQSVLASGTVPGGASAELGFRLGTLLDRAKRFDDAFSAFTNANALVRASFDPNAHRRATDALIQAWPAEALAPIDGAQPDHHVFIVGTPRSGTTLVERILAANPAVATAGETLLLPTAARTLGLARPPFQYITERTTPDAKAAEAAARQFTNDLRKAAKARSETVTIDKLPINAFFVTLAAMLFPHARFIGCLRDPRDVGLSCFQQNFGGGNPTMYDLKHIAHFQADTIRVMRHWATAVPDRFTLVEYEAVVGDLDSAARNLSNAAGINFDEASLRYWESAGPINTASYDQASRPVYTSSIGRWKNYEQHLAPLVDALRERGVNLN